MELLRESDRRLAMRKWSSSFYDKVSFEFLWEWDHKLAMRKWPSTFYEKVTVDSIEKEDAD